MDVLNGSCFALRSNTLNNSTMKLVPWICKDLKRRRLLATSIYIELYYICETETCSSTDLIIKCDAKCTLCIRCIRHEREAHYFLLFEIYKVWSFASISSISVRNNSPVGGYFGCYLLHPLCVSGMNKRNQYRRQHNCLFFRKYSLCV